MAKKSQEALSLEEDIRVAKKNGETRKYDLDSYADRKALERCFRDLADISLNTIRRTKNRELEYLTDCGKQMVNKRISAIYQMMPEAKKRYSEKYPLLSIEEELFSANSIFGMISYDILNSREHITLAAALWILDELSRRSSMDKLLSILPPEQETEGVRLPELFADSCYDNSIVAGMMYIIMNRNDDMIPAAPNIVKPFINEGSLKRAEKMHEYASVEDPLVSCETNRQKFDYIMSEINPHVISRAVRRFEEQEWGVFDRYLEIVNGFREEDLRLNAGILDDLLKQQKILPMLEKADEEDRQRIRSALKSTGGAPFAENPLLREIRNRITDLQGSGSRIISEGSLEDEYERLTDDINSRNRQKAHLETCHDMLAYILGCMEIHDDDQLKDVPEEVARILWKVSDFNVANPFESCFAFLYLLDSGNPLPWMTPLGAKVLERAATLLPWHEFPAFEDEEREEHPDTDDSFEDGSPSDDGEGVDPEEEEIWEAPAEDDSIPEDVVPIDWIAEEAKLYERNIKYAKYVKETREYIPDESTLLNFPQFAYRESSVVIPRDVYSNLDSADIYMVSGFDEKTAKLLEKYFALVDASWSKSLYIWKHRNKDSGDAVEEDGNDTEDEVRTDIKDADVDALKEDIRRLKEEIKESHDEKRLLTREKDALKTEKEELEKELSELRTMIRSGTESREEPEEIPEVNFPYAAKGRYVVFGGHDSWARAIRPLLENVRFIDRNARPDMGLILHADTVWLQSNAISHSDYYRIMNIIRTHSVNVEYFNYASAEKCAEQLALYDMERAEGEADR